MKTRIITVLLLKEQGLVKTIRFKDPTYVGDPINTIRIFNEKEVDEIVLLDIGATPAGAEPNYRMIQDIAGEAFMPVGYGGGITSFEQAKRIFETGIEKVVLNAAMFDQPALIERLIGVYGAQAVVACLDVRKNFFGRYELYSHGGKRKRPVSLDEHLAALRRLNVGEVIVNSMDRDGTMSGYDLALLRHVTARVEAPVVACGGAATVEDFRQAVDAGASAVAAGSMFVFRGKHRAVLISYPERKLLTQLLP